MKYEVARKTIFDGFPLKDAHFLKFWVDLLESFLHLFHWMWKFGGWIEAAIGESVFSATNVGRGLGSGEQATYYQEQKPRRGATGQLRTLTPISVVHWEFFSKVVVLRNRRFFCDGIPLATLVKQTWGNANLSQSGIRIYTSTIGRFSIVVEIHWFNGR